jgi:hypothetical protein
LIIAYIPIVMIVIQRAEESHLFRSFSLIEENGCATTTLFICFFVYFMHEDFGPVSNQQVRNMLFADILEIGSVRLCDVYLIALYVI